MNIALLLDSVLMEFRRYIGSKEVEGVAFEKLLHAFGVWLSFSLAVDFFIKQLPRQVTEQDSFCRFRCANLIEQIDEWRVGIIFKAGRNGRNIHQIIRFYNDEFGIQDTIVQARANDVDLRSAVELLPQISPIEVVNGVAVGIADNDLQGLCFYLPVDVVVVHLADQYAQVFSFGHFQRALWAVGRKESFHFGRYRCSFHLLNK